MTNLFDFGIRAAIDSFGWIIYVRGYSKPLHALRGEFDFSSALRAWTKTGLRGYTLPRA